VKRVSVCIGVALLLASFSGCLREEEPYFHMTVQFMSPECEIKESGNTTLFDADFVVSKCTPSDEKLHRDILSITVKDQNGDPIRQDERLETWTGWVPEGVHCYLVDGSGDPDLLETNDIIRLTGMDSRYVGGILQIKWDKNGHEIIGDPKLPPAFFEVEVQSFSVNPTDNITMLNISIEEMLHFDGFPNWSDIKIVIDPRQGDIIIRELEPYSESVGKGIHAWYIDCGTKPGKLSSGDNIIITGLTVDHTEARITYYFHGLRHSILTVPPLP